MASKTNESKKPAVKNLSPKNETAVEGGGTQEEVPTTRKAGGKQQDF